jgi:hypothetical protein
MSSYNFIYFSYIFFIENTIHTAILYLYILYILLINYISLIYRRHSGKIAQEINKHIETINEYVIHLAKFLPRSGEYIRKVYFLAVMADIWLELT